MTVILLYYPILIIFTNSDVYLETKGICNEFPYYSLLREYTLSVHFFTVSSYCKEGIHSSHPSLILSNSNHFNVFSISSCFIWKFISSVIFFFFLYKIFKFFFSLDPIFPYYHFLPYSLSLYSKTLKRVVCVSFSHPILP